MAHHRLRRNRAPLAAAVFGAAIAFVWIGDRTSSDDAAGLTRAQRLLIAEPWYCEVHDPEGRALVSSSVETFYAGGTLQGRSRLEDREAGRVLLEFSYYGVWQFDDPWLTEAIEEYSYLHVDEQAFSREQLLAIEAEFAEPEVSRVHALTRGQLVYGAQQSLYQCHRRPQAPAADGVAAELEATAEAGADMGRRRA